MEFLLLFAVALVVVAIFFRWIVIVIVTVVVMFFGGFLAGIFAGVMTYILFRLCALFLVAGTYSFFRNYDKAVEDEQRK